MKALSSIDNFNDLAEYTQAEYNEAVKYCSDSTTKNLYASAMNLAQEYAGKGASASDGDQGTAAFAQALSYISQARAAWKSAGCTKAAVSSGKKTGSTTSAPPGDDKEDEVVKAGIGGLGTWLLAGLGLLAVWYLMKDKGQKALPAGKKRRAAKARKTIRRRRRPMARRRRTR